MRVLFARQICIAIAFAVLLVPSVIVAQILEIVDSTGAGAGHPLDGPFWLVFDAAGSLYVTGDFSQNVLKITNPGLSNQAVIEIIDETGDGLGNPLNRPRGLAVDKSGNLYVAGGPSDNVFKIVEPGLPTQTIIEIIDETGDGRGNPLNNPQHLVADASAVYVSGEDPKHNVFKITDPGLPTQAIMEIIDMTGDGMGSILDRPRGLALDGSGSLYVAGGGSDNAFMITEPGFPAQTITEIIDEAGDDMGNLLDFPGIIAVGEQSTLYITGFFSDNVFKITDPGLPTQTIMEIIDATGDGTGNPFIAGNGAAVDPFGVLYVAGGGSDNAFKIRNPGLPTQAISEIIDEMGAGAAQPLDGPVGLALDEAGNVYIAGFNSDNIFKVIISRSVLEIPTLGTWSFAILGVLLCLAAVFKLAERKPGFS